MALNFEYFPAAGTTVAAGIFIPLVDLGNLTAGELEPGDADKESKVVLEIIDKLFDGITALIDKPLGLSVSKGTLVGVSTSTYNQTHSVTYTRMVNESAGIVTAIPLPTTGANSGKGSLGIADVFPLATKLDAATLTDGPGVLIPSTLLVNYGAPAHASVDMLATADMRHWFNGLVACLVDSVTRRSSSSASAIIASTRAGSAIFTPPSAFTDATNPTSGVLAAQLSQRTFLSTTYTITLQLIAQNYVVNNVSA